MFSLIDTEDFSETDYISEAGTDNVKTTMMDQTPDSKNRDIQTISPFTMDFEEDEAFQADSISLIRNLKFSSELALSAESKSTSSPTPRNIFSPKFSDPLLSSGSSVLVSRGNVEKKETKRKYSPVKVSSLR